MIKTLEEFQDAHEHEMLKWAIRTVKRNAIKLIEEIPAADVVERKKGKWISHLLDDGSFWANYCSECGVYLPYGLDWKPNGCPNCFADMRGDA